MSQENTEQQGWIVWLNRQSFPIRLASFIVFMILIIIGIIGVTIGMYYFNIANYPRLIPFAMEEGVSTTEYLIFEDDDAYPAAVASAPDGTLYTGSYVSGAVWQVLDNGQSFEIPASRDVIGSVIGIDVASDGTVYVLDHLDPFNAGGAKIWQISGTEFQLFADTTFDSAVPIAKPNDIAVDANGRVYVLDISLNQIVLFEGETASIWWQAPDLEYLIAGLAYHQASNRLLISDAAKTAIYAIPVDAVDTEASRETLFFNDTIEAYPSFNGLSVAEDGTIYVAAFDLNQIWRIMPGSNDYTVLADSYRGSSDVAYDGVNHRLYVNNWDQSWLIPITLVIMQVDVPPRLPFSVDVITFGMSAE